ncbi:MAG: hypothetical protein HYY30_08890 [Chloroflexi bacterium]|nr:hypothetical protein [Chloroflexota bacterium]
MNKIWGAGLISLVVSILLVGPAFAEDGGRVQFGRSIVIPAGQVVDGDLVAVGGNIVVDGQVYGDAVATGGNVDVSGEVIGQVVSVGGNVHLASTATVRRGVVVVGGSFQREEGAVVNGDIVETGPGEFLIPQLPPWSFAWQANRQPGDGFGLLFAIFSSLLAAIAFLALSVLAAVIFPEQLNVVRRTIESAPLQVLGVGVLSAIVSVMLTPILLFTCIGLPIFWMIVIAATLFGTVGIALLVGERLFLAIHTRSFTTILATAVGTLVIWMASLLPIFGGIFMLFVFFFGLGAVVLSRFGTISPPFSWQTRIPPGPRA